MMANDFTQPLPFIHSCAEGDEISFSMLDVEWRIQIRDRSFDTICSAEMPLIISQCVRRFELVNIVVLTGVPATG